jgi:alcohol dehydrogenase
MKAWRLYGTGRLELDDAEVPSARPGGVVVRMQAAPVLSYMNKVIDGSLKYALPPLPFVPGTNGAGIVEAIGPGVYHVKPGQRVILNPHHLADERIAEPAQVLIGLTAMGSARLPGISTETLALQRDWPDGVFAEYAQLPAACVTPLTRLESVPAMRLAALSKFVVPYGGFLRGGFEVGETAIVNGATGYFGSAAVLLAAALGASNVIASGRDAAALERVAKAAGPRVHPVALSGDVERDAEAMRAAAGGGADFALDMVGRANSSASTLAALKALRRHGRLVLMGSVTEALPISVGEMLANDWSVIGQFMYPKDAPARLLALIATGLLDLELVNIRRFALAELPSAMDAAARMRGLDATILECA